MESIGRFDRRRSGPRKVCAGWFSFPLGELCLSAFIFGPVMTSPRDFFGVAFVGMGCSEENAGEYWRDIAAQCAGMLEAPVQLMVLYPHLIFEKNGWPTPMWGRSVSWILMQSCGLNSFLTRYAQEVDESTEIEGIDKVIAEGRFNEAVAACDWARAQGKEACLR